MKKAAAVLVILFLCGMLIVSAEGESPDNNAVEENKFAFALDETIVYKSFCEMSSLYAEVLDDAAMADGWYYYYTDTDESPAHTIDWKPSDGNYTTAEVLFTVKNISDLPQTFGDKITAVLICRENEDAEAICFKGTVFQQNPGQVEENGEMIMWSTKPAEIAVGESANVSFRFDIPGDIYGKLYAAVTGENTENGMICEFVCEFCFDDETTYVIDLNESLIPASQYGF